MSNFESQEVIEPQKGERPLRRWIRRLSRVALWALGLLLPVAIVLGFLARQDINKRWREAQERATAAGIPQTWTEILPKPVPDAENFGALPDFKPFTEFEEHQVPPEGSNFTGWEKRYRDEAAVSAMLAIKSLPNPKAETGISPSPFKIIPIKDFRARAKETKRLTDTSDALSDADALLQIFSEHDTLWRRLHEGKSRAYSFLPIPARPHDTYRSFLNVPLQLTQIAKVKAIALLEQGNVEAAFEECKLMERLIGLSGATAVLDHLVYATEQGMLFNLLYRGLFAGKWTAPQLEQWESLLRNSNLLEHLRTSYRGEGLYLREAYKDRRNRYLPDIPDEKESVESKLFKKLFPSISDSIEEAETLEFLSNIIEGIHPQTALADKNAIDWPENRWSEILPLSAGMERSFNIYGSVFQSSIRTQTLLNLARVAIGLERYRKDNGQLPTTLEKLAPTYLPRVPVEILTGKPLRYILDEQNQTFKLYSTGWTGVDKAGQVDWSHPNDGNWSWP